MPATAEIACLVAFLANLDDARVDRRPFDEFVDLQFTKPGTETKVLFRRQVLVVEEDHLIVEQRLTDLADNPVIERLRQIDPRHLGAERAGNPVHLDVSKAHHRPPSAESRASVACRRPGFQRELRRCGMI